MSIFKKFSQFQFGQPLVLKIRTNETKLFWISKNRNHYNKNWTWFWARQCSTSSTLTISHFVTSALHYENQIELFRVTFIWSQWTSASSSFPKFIFGCVQIWLWGWVQEFFKLFRVTFIPKIIWLYWSKPTHSIPKIGLCIIVYAWPLGFSMDRTDGTQKLFQRKKFLGFFFGFCSRVIWCKQSWELEEILTEFQRRKLI